MFEIWNNFQKKIKKRSEETQTLRAVCPAADPLSGGAGQPKFNQLEKVTIFSK